jgi:hypothetical protein
VTVATEGLPAQAGTILGRLFITYDVELNLPALPTGDNHLGKSLTLWTPALSTTDPPMGDPMTVIPLFTDVGLTYGTAIGNNVMALLPSNGPWARPNLPTTYQGGLVAWTSASSISDGMQHLSFANEGTYLLELFIIGTVLPGDIATAVTLTPDIQITEVQRALTSASMTQYYRFTCVSTGPDQSISLTRQNPTSIVTQTVLTVCA